MRVLIIHHLEPIWDSALRERGMSFEELSRRMLEHIGGEDYDWVILTQFERREAQSEHYITGIAHVVDDWQDYAYGWGRDLWDGAVEGVDYAEGGYHSETVRLDDWMRDLKGHKVYISGAFDGECIEDLEIALGWADVEFTRLNHLII